MLQMVVRKHFGNCKIGLHMNRNSLVEKISQNQVDAVVSNITYWILCIEIILILRLLLDLVLKIIKRISKDKEPGTRWDSS